MVMITKRYFTLSGNDFRYSHKWRLQSVSVHVLYDEMLFRAKGLKSSSILVYFYGIRSFLCDSRFMQDKDQAKQSLAKIEEDIEQEKKKMEFKGSNEENELITLKQK